MLLRLWSAIKSILAKYQMLLPIAALSLLAFAYWESSAPERAREKMAREKETVGTTASLAGNLWASAYRECRRIGIADVSKCAQWKGPLVDDIAAAAFAETAVQQRSNFESLCNRHHDLQYCNQLLNRAFQLALTRPQAATE
jgi:hypothetical protein